MFKWNRYKWSSPRCDCLWQNFNAWFIHVCMNTYIAHMCIYVFVCVPAGQINTSGTGIWLNYIRLWLVVDLLCYKGKTFFLFIDPAIRGGLPQDHFRFLPSSENSIHPLKVKTLFHKLVTLTRNSEGLKFLGHKIVRSYRKWISAQNICSQQFQYKKIYFQAPHRSNQCGFLTSSDSTYFTISGRQLFRPQTNRK